MIVDTMTLDEIVLELQKDDAFLNRQRTEMVKKDMKIERIGVIRGQSEHKNCEAIAPQFLCL